jgi:sec-independent protein translocase protein TatA
MGAIGMQEMILIFLVVLLLFGSKRLPELARGLGKGIREFKKATRDLKDELDVGEIERDIKKDLNDVNPKLK